MQLVAGSAETLVAGLVPCSCALPECTPSGTDGAWVEVPVGQDPDDHWQVHAGTSLYACLNWVLISLS